MRTMQTAVSYTRARDAAAGAELGRDIARLLGGERPDALIVFASPTHDFAELLSALGAACHPRLIVGCSSAGEFVTGASGAESASAVAIRAPEMRFGAVLARGIGADHAAAATQMASEFHGVTNSEYRFRTALVLTDALAGLADEFVEALTMRTAGMYQFAGGGAGDDAKFSRTHVFFGPGGADAEIATDAAVALEILSNNPIGIGVRHGWQPAGVGMRVTEAEGARLVSLNAMPAAEAVAEYAESTGQSFDRHDPLPFFLHNVIGIQTETGHKLRVPLSVNADGSISCAAEVPEGATVHFMRATSASASDAARDATHDAVRQLGDHPPGVALFFDCVATRLRMGDDFALELDALQTALAGADYAGFNTYGQIARADGQFSGFHNCTAVVCVLPG
jgi:hypothetical protein